MSTKSLCMLARGYTPDIDPTGWLMSEKYDGVRMIRPAGSKVILSREGNPFNPPAWWLAQLPPNIFLDAEAWIGRGQFELVRSILQSRRQVSGEWEQIKLMVIEAPLLQVSLYGPLVQRIEQAICRGREHMEQFYEQVVAGGGEGVMLRHPLAAYHLGRSPYLLRVKPELKGAAIVVGYHCDDDGELLSLACENWGVRFHIHNGLTAALKANPPAIGSQIRYRYQYLNRSGVPKFGRLEKL